MGTRRTLSLAIPSKTQAPKLYQEKRTSEYMLACSSCEDFRNATFGDYSKAREKAKLAEVTSDLATDEESQEGKRKRVQKLLSSSESSSEGSFLPSPPKIKRAAVANRIIIKPKTPNDRYKLIQPNSNNISDSDEELKDTEQNKENMLPKLPVTSSAKSDIMYTKLDPKSNNSRMPQKSTQLFNPEDNAPNNANFKTLMDQNHVLRSIMTETLQEVRKIRTFMIEMDMKAKSGNVENDENISFLSRFPELTFPLTSEADLDKLNEILSDRNNFDSAVREFSRLGGTNTYNFTGRLLSLLMSNELAIKFSFLGRKGKKKFQGCHISQLVINSAERGNISKSCIEVEKTISLWLRRASDRKKKTYCGLNNK